VININEKDDESIKTQIETLSQQIYREELVLKVEKIDENPEYKLVKSQEKPSGEVLFDDRAGISIGAKLTDSELIGCPYILVISKRSLENGGVELKIRETGETHIINLS
jgi:prolyl-tRNA synthetase